MGLSKNAFSGTSLPTIQGQRIVRADAVFIHIVVMAVVRAIVEGCYTDIYHSMSVNPL